MRSCGLVAVAWMGYDDNRSTGLTGSSGAMKIWSRLFGSISTEPYQLTPIAGIETVSIDRDSGLLGGKGCENTVELPFITGSQPQQAADCAEQEGSSWFEQLFGN